MKANELRIGNWVKCDEPARPWQKVVSIDLAHQYTGGYAVQLEGKCTHGVSQLEGIVLSEEILLNVGFELFPWGWVKGKIRLSVYPTDFSGILSYVFQTGNGLNIHLASLHQLQNLYFAITGEELEVGQ